MKILGIDPGTALIGWGIIEDTAMIECGALRTKSNIQNRERVQEVFDFFTALIKKHKPDIVALEKLFFFKNAKTVMQVSEIRGVLLLAAARLGRETREFTPLQIIQAISGYGRAGKDQVQRMVMLILGLKTAPKPDDVTDALALAICTTNTVQY